MLTLVPNLCPSNRVYDVIRMQARRDLFFSLDSYVIRKRRIGLCNFGASLPKIADQV